MVWQLLRYCTDPLLWYENAPLNGPFLCREATPCILLDSFVHSFFRHLDIKHLGKHLIEYFSINLTFLIQIFHALLAK